MLKLRLYQLRAVKYVLKNLRRKKSIMVQSPVATGKTAVLVALASRWAKQARRTLILAHREELINQAVEQLRAQGLEPGVIRAGWKHLEDPDALVQVASVQTLCRRKRISNVTRIIIDEAHHTPAETYRRILAQYPKAELVGLSATPIYNGRGALADCFKDLHVALEPEEAVELKAICPWDGKVWTAPSLAGVKKVRGDYQQTDLGRRMSQRHIVGDIVNRWKECASDKSTMLFAATIPQCQTMIKAFQKAGVKAEYLTGDSRPEVRASTLARFAAGEFPVLCNVGLFTEGTNIERVKCIILARPTQSVGLYLQMVGRGRRPWQDQTCVIHDHGNLLADHKGPDDPRNWRLGGKSDRDQLVMCPKCRTARDPAVKRCPQGCTFKGGSKGSDPAWILKGNEHDAQQFLLMRDEKRKEAVRLWKEEGLSVARAAKQLQMSTRTILAWLRASGIDTGSRQAAARALRNKICALREQGLTISKIAGRLRVAPTKVRTVLKWQGISRKESTAARDAEVCQLYRARRSINEITKKLRMGAPTVYEVLRRNRIKLRSRAEAIRLRDAGVAA